MELGRISSAKSGCDSTLGVRSRAIEERSLGDDEDVVGLRRSPRSVQSRDAASNDQEPCPDPVCHDPESTSRRANWEPRFRNSIPAAPWPSHGRIGPQAAGRNYDWRIDAEAAGSGFALTRILAGAVEILRTAARDVGASQAVVLKLY